jgi:SAM-dependent methyltransferase
MNTFKDLFSVQAKDYAKYRPTYPPELFQFLSTISKKRNKVWDVGTGNGQAAIELSKYFDSVFATDPSEKQIAEAAQAPNITYKVEAAETPTVENVDLITVAQAFHWFKHDQFAEACKKVAAPNCHLVVWSYAICSITPEVDAAVEKLYNGLLGPYWEKERKLVENGYSTVVMPFTEITPPKIDMSIDWSFEQFSGYLKTWSALQTYLKTNSTTKIEEAFADIAYAWGIQEKRKITWPMNVRIWAIKNGENQ